VGTKVKPQANRKASMNDKITREQIEYFLGSDNVSKDDLLGELETLANGEYEVQQFKKDVSDHWNYSKRDEEL